MIRSRVAAPLALGSLIFAVAGQSTAQARYVDEQGNAHWVASEAHVPERYRNKIVTPALPQVVDKNTGLVKSTDKFLRENRGKWAAQDEAEAKERPTAMETAQERYLRERHERDVLEWNRNQAAIAEAKQAEFDKKLARKCNSVRSDQATPALLAQCQQLLGR